MNAPLRRVGVVVLVLFALLFLNLNYVQAYKADDYRNNDYNARVETAQYQRARGKIIVGGQAVAQSRETTDSLKYRREYPAGPVYAHIVGYKPVRLAATGVEKIENDYLSGNDDKQLADRLAAIFTGATPAGGNVVLSVSKAAQETAYRELTNNKVGVPKGAVVAVDPKTGGILAAVSTPSFDPNPLADHSTTAAAAAYTKLDTTPNKPLLNRAFSETYPPGSTFKVIVSAAALAAGDTPDTVLPAGPTYKPPQTSTFFIKNASPSTCPEATITLREALTVSCNTAFARYGVEKLGADTVKQTAEAFGFESAPLIDQDPNNVYNVAVSRHGPMTGPDGKVDPPALAQSCIGQNNVRMTTLEGALVAASVANAGSQMRPYVVQELKGADLTTVDYRATPRELRHPMSANVASQLQDMMISVVENGTGRNAGISGFRVGGKTGTAENADAAQSHGWFIGFAMKGNDPIAAVSVFLENAGQGGSAEAARIAGQVMRAVISERGLK